MSFPGAVRFRRESVCTAWSPASLRSTYIAQSLGWSKPVWYFSATMRTWKSVPSKRRGSSVSANPFTSASVQVCPPDSSSPENATSAFMLAIPVLLDVLPHAEVVFQRGLAAGGHHHRLGLAVQLAHDVPAEVLDDDLDFLADGGRVQVGEAGDPALRLLGLEGRVVLDGLLQAVVRLVGHVVLQHVEDEALLDRLAHGVQVEGVGEAVRAARAEALQRHVARGGGEGEAR